MKTVGVLLVLMTGIGYGLWGYLRLKRRSDSLERLAHLCEQLAERIRYTAAPLEELLGFFAASSEWRDFCLLRDLRPPLTAPRDAWLDVVRQSTAELGISAEDERLLCEFVTDFGAADLTGEVRRCRQYAAMLRERGETARNDVRCRGRLYITLGFCGGSALALLLG